MENLQIVNVNELENVAGGMDWGCVGVFTLAGAAAGSPAGPPGVVAGAVVGFTVGLLTCDRF